MTQPVRIVEAVETPAAPAHGAFRALVGDTDWLKLPPAVRSRFERELAPGESAAFVGEVATTQRSRFGRAWAQVARLFGAPLPLSTLERAPAAVVVTQDLDPRTQYWTRIYALPGRLPQVIRSGKRFAGPTGIEECVGAGLGMALAVSVEGRALVFRSREYFWRWRGLRVRIPDWLTPGCIAVIHREERAGRFSFTLVVTHPWFGETIRQVAFFRDAG